MTRISAKKAGVIALLVLSSIIALVLWPQGRPPAANQSHPLSSLKEWLAESREKSLLRRLAESGGDHDIEHLCQGSRRLAFDKEHRVIAVVGSERVVSFMFTSTNHAELLRRSSKQSIGNSFLTHNFGHESGSGKPFFEEIVAISRRGGASSEFLLGEKGSTNYVGVAFELKTNGVIFVEWTDLTSNRARALDAEHLWPKGWPLPLH
jgi:hypothetical protein